MAGAFLIQTKEAPACLRGPDRMRKEARPREKREKKESTQAPPQARIFCSVFVRLLIFDIVA